MFWNKKKETNIELGDLVKIDLKPDTRHQAEWYKSVFGEINGELGLVVNDGMEIVTTPFESEKKTFRFRYKVYVFSKGAIQSFLPYQLFKQQ